MIDREQLYTWWRLFQDNGREFCEIRCLDGQRTYSGYYRNIENIIRDIEPLSERPNMQMYFVMNKISDDCYERPQCERMIEKPKNTTTDQNIEGRKWIMLDFDTDRAAGVGSTDQQWQEARAVALKVYDFLKAQGFYDPIVTHSGNGVHIYIRVNLANNDENKKLIERFLHAMSMMFSDDKVKIDLAVANAARITKLVGTMAKKGTNTANRPWRMSKYLHIPAEIKPNDKAYIEKIANMYPEERPAPSKENNYGQSRFDLVGFLNKHNLKYREAATPDGIRYILQECPFDAQHKDPDSMVFQHNNGAVAFFCYHNSCSSYTWKDFRLHFEPDAYDKKDYAEYEHRRNYYGYHANKTTSLVQVTKDDKEKGVEWMTLNDIKYVDISSLVHIPTGYTILDKKIMGLLLGDVTVMSGLSGSGKTSWLDCLALNVVDRGVKTAIWSGELQDFRFQSWIDQIAAGKNYVRKKEGYDGLYYCPKQTAERINSWLGDKLLLYNNRWGNKWGQIFNGIRDAVEKRGCKLIILDNLMALNITDYDGDKYSQQTQFINDIKEYAKLWNIHIILVAHPRKDMGFLRKESISGTADLTNLCDNCFIIHRVNRDFKNRGSEFLGAEKINEYLGFDAVLEVAKNRSMGVVDELIGMYYERESRRLKNEISENVIYGWMEEGKQAGLAMPAQEERFVPSNPTAGLTPNTSFDDSFPTDPEDGDVPF
jgi:hypothetical protein